MNTPRRWNAIGKSPFEDVAANEDGAGSAIANGPESLERTLDWRAIGAAVYRSRWYILACVGLSLLGGVAVILLTPPTYRARASVEISPQSTRILGTEDIDPAMSSSDVDRFLQTQVDILESRALAARVDASLRLSVNDNFLVAMGAKASELNSREVRRRAVLDLLQKNLTITLPQNTRVLEISFTSRDPATSALVANSYSESFIQSNIDRKFSTTAYSRAFLSAQLAQAKIRLENSEKELIGYSRAAKLIDASSGAAANEQQSGPRSLTTANLIQLNNSYVDAQARRIEAEERWRQAAGLPVMALPEVLSNPTVQALDQRRADMRANLATLRERLQPDHPTVVQAVAQLNATDKQIGTVSKSIKDAIYETYRTALRQENALANQVSSLKTDTLSEQDRGVQYNILKREVDTNRQLYEGLLQRFKEVSAEAGAVANNVIAVDTAETPKEQVSPKVNVILVISIALGGVLAGLFVMAREKLDDSIRNPHDLETKLQIPLIGVIPRVTESELALDTVSKSSLAEAYHSIRTAIELSSGRGAPKSLLLTSSRKGEGKSTSALFIAKAFADVGRRTLIIDADLRMPSLHTLLDHKKEDGGGFSSILARRVPLESAISKTPVANLDFIPSGPLPPNAAQLLGESSIADILQELGGIYDIIIIDSPPAISLADAIQLSAEADATLFVVEAGGAHYGQAKYTARRLRAVSSHLIGGVVTKYDPNGWGASYDYYDYNYKPGSDR
jgi:polysaccharide biosynthesis transport protein